MRFPNHPINPINLHRGPKRGGPAGVMIYNYDTAYGGVSLLHVPTPRRKLLSRAKELASSKTSNPVLKGGGFLVSPKTRLDEEETRGKRRGEKKTGGEDDGQDGVRAKYAKNRKKAVATENKPRLLRNTTAQYGVPSLISVAQHAK